MLMNDQCGELVKTTGTFESFDGTPIYYEVRGTGKPLVLCYGIACLFNHWAPQLRYFSREYQTIVFDYRGHHNTGAPADLNNATLDALCHDVSGLLRHLGIKKASFWGHSFGVPFILRTYELYPQLFKNMVFINGFARNPLKGMFGLDFVPQIFYLAKESHDRFPELFRAFWKFSVMNPVSIPLSAMVGGFNLSLISFKDIEIYARGVAHLDMNTFLRLFEDMMNYDGYPVLESVACPVLVMSGSKDGVTPYSHQLEMHHKLKGSEFMRVPYGSHCTQLDMPEIVNLRIEKFLRDHEY